MDKTDTYAFLDHISWLIDQGAESCNITLEQVHAAHKELNERIKSTCHELRGLNAERARLSKLVDVMDITPTIPADTVVPLTASSLAADPVVAPAADPLAPVPAAVAPDASANVDATNTAPAKAKKSPSEIRRQRLRGRTTTERLVKKK
ncbi:hypothetical protein GGI01_003476 [Coemansia sp. RSA 376]|nr:hypothetical protein H4S03_001486 [Coemansia sp. S3946]KAJ2116118.1 hypothetical protein IW146_001783 [Coemansia sp. RSA 922]KAJ2259699.1 hypothetical protein GGI01_003476 [Coemansia sp. RSA 376]